VDVALAADGVVAAVADDLRRELDSEAADDVVAYRGGRRWVLDYSARPVAAGRGRARLRDGGVYVVTGGLGGIGIEIGAHLVRTLNAHVVLTGRSALPDRATWAAWRAEHGDGDDTGRRIARLQALEDGAGRVEYVAADVADPDAMRALLARVRERRGRLDGVVHAAGLAGGRLIDLKTPVDTDVLRPKVAGTLALADALADTRPDFVVLCSSLLAIASGPGQVDYVAANAFLDAFARYRRARGDTAVLSVNWDRWDDVGMAAPRRVGTGRAVVAAEGTASHPLLGARLGEPPSRVDDECRYRTDLRVAALWLLDEHRVSGRAVLPGAAYLELARAAYADVGGAGTLEVRDVVLRAPLVVADDETRAVQTALRRVDSGWRFTVSAVAEETVYASGTLAPAARAPRVHDVAVLRARCGRRTLVAREGEAARAASEGSGAFRYGRRWWSVRRLHIGDGECLAELELPEGCAADLDVFPLHPALVDVATGIAARFAEAGRLLPVSYGRVLVFGPVPRRVCSYARKRSTAVSDDVAAWDIVLTDEAGVEVVVVEGFLLRPIADLEAHIPGQAAAESPMRGLSTRDGIETFERVLAPGLPAQVIVSTRDLAGYIARMRTVSAASLAERRTPGRTGRVDHRRPDLAQLYTAPRNRLEEEIAGIWRDVLGIAEVGVHDSFLDLGGDSLMGIRVVGRVRETLGVELSLAALVADAPTIAQLAVAIVQRLAESGDTETVRAALDEEEGATAAPPAVTPVAGAVDV
jgi:NAD(P)-dependent dehydrogenase (short-subunit alcohol dehydrogenase family)/acyl carrier protein